MAVLPRQILYSFFETNDKPTQAQFASLIQSMLNVTDDRKLLGLKEYDNTRAYLSGDTVIYNNAIYQAIASTSGTFNVTAWKKLAGAVPQALVYKGTWNADTNEPDLLEIDVEAGDTYVVTVAGDTDLDGNTGWQIGDWAVSNGTTWQKISNDDVIREGANVEGEGVGVFKEKTGTALRFKKIQTNDGSLYVAVDPWDNFIDLGINFDDTTALPFRAWSAQKIQLELDKKIDKPVSSSLNNFATFTGDGSIQDIGIDADSFLPSTTVAENIPFNPSGNIVAENVQDAIEEVDGILTNTIDDLDSHINDYDNPHNVTKTQIGLGNVTNERQMSLFKYDQKPEKIIVTTTPTSYKFEYNLPDGDFLFEWYYEMAGTDPSTVASAIVYLDGVKIGECMPRLPVSGLPTAFSGFYYASLAKGLRKVMLEFACRIDGVKVEVQRVRLKLVKV